MVGSPLPSDPAGSWNRLAVDRVDDTPGVAYVFGAKTPTSDCGGAFVATKRRSLDEDHDFAGDQHRSGLVRLVCRCHAEQYRTKSISARFAGFRGNLSGTTWTWTPVVTNGANSIHPDQHCLTFSPANSSTIYAGNDGGIFKSTNKGATWTAEQLPGHEARLPRRAHCNLMAGTQDNGTIFRIIGSVWGHIADGDGGDCGINQTSLLLYPFVLFRHAAARAADR